MIVFNSLDESYMYANDAKDLQRQLMSDYDVSLRMSGRGELVTIDKIKVSEKSGGVGTEVMKHICEWADNNFITLALTPSSDLGGNKNRLQKFYKRFGFVDNKGRNKDYEISESMYRHPE
jgi:hypothetical protein